MARFVVDAVRNRVGWYVGATVRVFGRTVALGVGYFDGDYYGVLDTWADEVVLVPG